VSGASAESPSSLPAPRPASSSRVEMTELVIPQDTNLYGNIFGGRVMELIDKAAAVASLRHCRTNVVTASVDSLDFIHPIRLGNIVTLLAQVNASWGSSMEVGVKVFSEDALTGERLHTCTAYVTTVALGPDGRPTRIPPVIAESADERRRQGDSALRRDRRLERVRSRQKKNGPG
jgi:acyl-CoA hydrolase